MVKDVLVLSEVFEFAFHICTSKIASYRWVTILEWQTNLPEAKIIPGTDSGLCFRGPLPRIMRGESVLVLKY